MAPFLDLRNRITTFFFVSILWALFVAGLYALTT